ncbi:MAG: triose-phosphate isomerase [Phycisphaerae bacterium]
MRRPFVAGNWKMHKTLAESRELMKGIRQGRDPDLDVTVAVCPPAQLLMPMCKEINGTPIKLGAQNCHYQSQGAFTGELSPRMLIDAGCTYVIIGHSERRQLFGETNALLARKVPAAISAGLEVIYCVGETLEQRQAEKTEQVLTSQMEEVLTAGIDLAKLTLAYEPVWAIGTGQTATPDQAQSAHRFIRGWLAERFSPDRAQAVVIQYGGSVKPGNAAELMACPDVDGALVGGACLVADDFLAIIRAAGKAQA